MKKVVATQAALVTLIALAWLGSLLAAEPADTAAESDRATVVWRHPKVGGYGKVVQLPDAVDQPRDDSRVLVDLTSDTPPGTLNPGLNKVARFVNIFAGAGKDAADLELHVVLHGGATELALRD